VSGSDSQRLAGGLEGEVPREVLELYERDVPRRAGPWRLFSVDEAIAAYRSSRAWVPESAALRFFWTDGQSSHAAVAIGGPVRGTVAVVISTRPSYAPRFRSVASFLASCDGLDEDDDWEEGMAFDYPSVGDLAPAHQAADGELVANLELALAADPGARRHWVACLIAVVPPAQAGRLLPFAGEADDELAASACVRLGNLGYAPAIPRLLEIAFGSRGVPAGAAAGALATMGAAAAAPTLARLSSSPVPDPRVAASILHAAGVEVREAKEGWQYRDPVRDDWRNIPV
jgi:hypothetical protein